MLSSQLPQEPHPSGVGHSPGGQPPDPGPPQSIAIGSPSAQHSFVMQPDGVEPHTGLDPSGQQPDSYLCCPSPQGSGIGVHTWPSGHCSHVQPICSQPHTLQSLQSKPPEPPPPFPPGPSLHGWGLQSPSPPKGIPFAGKLPPERIYITPLVASMNMSPSFGPPAAGSHDG